MKMSKSNTNEIILSTKTTWERKKIKKNEKINLITQ